MLRPWSRHSLRGGSEKLEGAFFPLYSLLAPQAGGATEGGRTRKRKRIQKFLVNITTGKRKLVQRFLSSEEKAELKSHLARPWTARPPDVIISSYISRISPNIKKIIAQYLEMGFFKFYLLLTQKAAHELRQPGKMIKMSF